MVNDSMLAMNCEPVMDENYAAFRTNGLTVTAPSALKSWIAARRTSLENQLSSVSALPFAVTTTDYSSLLSPVTISTSPVSHSVSHISYLLPTL